MTRPLLRLAYLAGTLCCAAALSPATARGYHGETIESHGTAESRVDVVFVGDGYTEAEVGTFRDDVDKVVEHLFSEVPFSEYRSYFNLHVVDVISAESGIDRPSEGVFKDTALDMQYGFAGQRAHVVNTPNPEKVLDAAEDAPIVTEIADVVPYDLIVVLVNDVSSGGGRAAATPSRSCTRIALDRSWPRTRSGMSSGFSPTSMSNAHLPPSSEPTAAPSPRLGTSPRRRT